MPAAVLIDRRRAARRRSRNVNATARLLPWERNLHTSDVGGQWWCARAWTTIIRLHRDEAASEDVAPTRSVDAGLAERKRAGARGARAGAHRALVRQVGLRCARRATREGVGAVNTRQRTPVRSSAAECTRCGRGDCPPRPAENGRASGCAGTPRGGRCPDGAE